MPIFPPDLVYSQNPRASLLCALLFLLSTIEGGCGTQVAANIVKVLHLVNANDPIHSHSHAGEKADSDIFTLGEVRRGSQARPGV